MKKWTHTTSNIGTTLTSLLSCAACPLCFPIYGGLLSLLGVELSEINGYFYPIMVLFIVGTWGLMGRQLWQRRSQRSKLRFSFGLALLGGFSIMLSAAYGFEMGLYGSILAFVASTFWQKRLVARDEKPHGHPTSTKCCPSERA